MEKPISMLISETKSNLVKVCNESNLHISVLQLIFAEMKKDIDQVARQCAEEERTNYQALILKKNESKEATE